MKKTYFKELDMKVIFFVFAAVLSVAPFRALPDDDIYLVTENDVNIRADSTVSSPSLGVLSKNDEVKVLADNFNWKRIILPPGFSCYIFSDLAVPIDEERVKITAYNVNLRGAPSLTASIVGQCPEGVIFPLVKNTNGWLEVDAHPYASGWVHKKFLSPLKERLSSLVKVNIPKLKEKSLKKKRNIHAAFIEQGKEYVPILESYLPGIDENTAYSLIIIFTGMARNNPELIPYFLQRISYDEPKTSAIYLDALQNVLFPESEKTAYFYQADNGNLKAEEIKKAKDDLRKKYLKDYAGKKHSLIQNRQKTMPQ